MISSPSVRAKYSVRFIRLYFVKFAVAAVLCGSGTRNLRLLVVLVVCLFAFVTDQRVGPET